MKQISGEEFRRKQAENAVPTLLDVREPAEFETEHVPGSRNVPLSGFKKAAGAAELSGPVYLLCRTGARASEAARQLESRGGCEVFVIDGGLEALKKKGAETVRGSSRVWGMERQVRFGAGLMVLAGVAAGWFFHSAFFLLAAFVAAGLVYSAVTDTCGMALLLAKCPWNKVCK